MSLFSFFQRVSHWGVHPEMSVMQQRQVMLANQISMISFGAVSIVLCAFLLLRLWTNVLFISAVLGLLVTIPLANRRRYYGWVLVTFMIFPLMMISMSVISKLLGQSNAQEFVLAPRNALVIIALYPLMIFYQSEKWKQLIAILPGMLGLLFFEEIHGWFGIRLDTLPFAGLPFVIKMSYVVVMLSIGFGIRSIQGINEVFDARIRSLLQSTAEKNEELALQNELISAKNQQIADSIQYAQRIQQAILPSVEVIRQQIPDCFVFFRPRDVVSGDFYFFEMVSPGVVLVAAVDCTGHGVPGAFMSMIAHEALNEIVHERHIEDPGQALTELHRLIRRSLKQEVSGNHDGMDIILCRIDRTQGSFTCAGAKNPLFYVRDGLLHEIKAERWAIGGQGPAERSYQTHAITPIAGDMFYLFSDGFQDQFGGPQGRKFMVGQFKKLLTSLAPLPTDIQHQRLEQTLRQWMQEGGEAQVDDVLIWGIRW